jgi:uncharacterized protein (TIGR02265 family)
MHSEFLAPDFQAPLDVEKYLRAVPVGAKIKGTYVNLLLEALGPKRERIPESRIRYFPFKDYPLEDQVRLIAQVAQLLNPNLPLRQAIRLVGHRVYPTFSSSLLGKVLFAAVGTDTNALLHAGAKAYRMSASVGKVEVVESGAGAALLHLTDMYNYIDCYHIGILEGAFSVLGLEPTFEIQLESPIAAWFKLIW